MVAAPQEPFRQRLTAAVAEKGSALCVGIDPAAAELPAHLGQGVKAARSFCLQLIEETGSVAAAFKPNAAFFEALGAGGWELLREVVQEASRRALVVVDAKRGDIGHTAVAYAAAIFDQLGADACTVNPYLGRDSLRPFLERQDRMAFVVCRTSNPGAADLQDLRVAPDGQPLYLRVAASVAAWASEPPGGTAGLVVGSTWPEELGRVRKVAPELPLLLPGIGAQGGDLEACVGQLAGSATPYLISVSRGIAGASSGPDFAAAAGQAAASFRARIAAAQRAA